MKIHLLFEPVLVKTSLY